MTKPKLTVWKAACIITGYGIGGGVLAIPYLTARCGALQLLWILPTACFVSWLMHMMIAEMVQKCGTGTQIVAAFSRLLFRGKYKKPLTLLFFALMVLVLLSNLTTYLLGGEEVLSALFSLPPPVCHLLFYALSAAVVLSGLKTLGTSEQYAVAAIFLLVGILAVCSLRLPRQTLPTPAPGLGSILSLFSVSLLAFTCFFSVPQALEGLGGDLRKTRLAVTLGMGNIFVVIALVAGCSLLVSREITEVATVGWCAAIGPWAMWLGNGFTFLAMLTSFWSISMALADMVQEQCAIPYRLSWLLATLPPLLLALFSGAGFLDILSLAGGAVAMVAALMMIPAYRNSRREIPGGILGKLGGTAAQLLVLAAYLLMTVGAVL